MLPYTRHLPWGDSGLHPKRCSHWNQAHVQFQTPPALRFQERSGHCHGDGAICTKHGDRCKTLAGWNFRGERPNQRSEFELDGAEKVKAWQLQPPSWRNRIPFKKKKSKQPFKTEGTWHKHSSIYQHYACMHQCIACIYILYISVQVYVSVYLNVYLGKLVHIIYKVPIKSTILLVIIWPLSMESDGFFTFFYFSLLTIFCKFHKIFIDIIIGNPHLWQIGSKRNISDMICTRLNVDW